MTAAEIAAREWMPGQEAKNTWPGSFSTKTGESSHKVEGTSFMIHRDLCELLLKMRISDTGVDQ